MTKDFSKPYLTIAEASAYFGIGLNRFRLFVNNHKDADWLLYNGRKTLIKKKKLEEYLNSLKTLL